MQTLLINDAPARLIQPMTEDEFFAFCQLNRHSRIERESDGEIVIMPPAGFASSNRASTVVEQLSAWARRKKNGQVAGPDAGYTLPNGAVRSPDASWVSNARLASLTPEDYEKFAHVCPEFVVEILSPTDGLAKTKDKMEEWIANGCLLGWLIEPKRRRIYVYRPGTDPELLEDPASIKGEGPLAGFTLKLATLWPTR